MINPQYHHSLTAKVLRPDLMELKNPSHRIISPCFKTSSLIPMLHHILPKLKSII